MTARRGPTAAVLTAVAVALLAACGARPAGVAAPGPSVGTSLDAPVASRILDLAFTTTTGRVVHLRDLAGKVVVLSDAMTLCQQTCPLDTATLVSTARDEDGHGHRGDTVFVSLTVDPARDTGAQLAAYRRLFTPAPANWLVLTGTAAAVDTLWDYFGVWRQKRANPAGPDRPTNWRTGTPLTYDIAHSDEVFFLDPHGHERFVLEGPPNAPTGAVPKTLYQFMDDDGHHNLTSPDPTTWTQAQAEDVLAWLRQR